MARGCIIIGTLVKCHAILPRKSDETVAKIAYTKTMTRCYSIVRSQLAGLAASNLRASIVDAIVWLRNMRRVEMRVSSSGPYSIIMAKSVSARAQLFTEMSVMCIMKLTTNIMSNDDVGGSSVNASRCRNLFIGRHRRRAGGVPFSGLTLFACHLKEMQEAAKTRAKCCGGNFSISEKRRFHPTLIALGAPRI